MSWMKKFKLAPTDVIEFLFECLASCLYDTLKLASPVLYCYLAFLKQGLFSLKKQTLANGLYNFFLNGPGRRATDYISKEKAQTRQTTSSERGYIRKQLL